MLCYLFKFSNSTPHSVLESILDGFWQEAETALNNEEQLHDAFFPLVSVMAGMHNVADLSSSEPSMSLSQTDSLD